MDRSSHEAATLDLTPSATRPLTPPPRSADRAAMQPLGSLSSLSSASHHGRFTPGQMLAGRYRIVGLLGRGGMGEVYRADDLVLGAQVALKFLPTALSGDPARLQRFLGEVRTTRQISHPAVCRVYDVGEVQVEFPAHLSPPSHDVNLPPPRGPVQTTSMYFLSMEYIDGEDLSSLLRRIGRLPKDKALDVARQICAGLAAAHDLGVVHRDLKPANIMLDGRGRARVTDFGVAGIASTLNATGDITAGTPAYMAPEQLAGQEVTTRSDIYSLGLVLYELFTGRAVWADKTASLAELRRLHQSSDPQAPSTHVQDMDPLVERVILRCLAREPEKRPSSALAVAAALPGGDPLAAALAAGETPSPAMVAAAGRESAITARTARLLLATFALALVGILLITPATSMLHYLGPPLPPEVLKAKARDIMAALGHAERPAHSAASYEIDYEAVKHLRGVAKEAQETDWRPRLADPRYAAMRFYYRASPTVLDPTPAGQPFTTYDDPPQTFAGSARLALDTTGRLIRYERVPSRVETVPTPGEALTVDWSKPFALAGLDLAAFTPTAPTWTPLSAADARAAWTGDIATSPPTPVRIEAASERGDAVFFRIIYPWTKPDRTVSSARIPIGARVIGIAGTILLVSAVLGGVTLAWVNLRAKRSDIRGGAVIAMAILLMTWASISLGPDDLKRVFHLGVLLRPLYRAAWMGMFMWVFYIALEPVVRKLWPWVLISWSRLIAGRFRDPLVGRDLLIGCAGGMLLSLLLRLSMLLPGVFGHVPATPIPGSFDALRHARGVLVIALSTAAGMTVFSILMVMLLIGMRFLLRRNKAAIIATWIALTLIQANSFEFSNIGVILSPFIAAMIAFTLIRFGFLATAMFFISANLLLVLPITTDLSAWYAPITFFACGLLIAVALYGFVIAQGVGARRVGHVG